MKLVSACLVGVRCRYSGASRSDPELVARFAEGELCPACPELLGGLGVPRPPAEIRGGAGAEVLDGRARVVDREGRDLTAAFIAGAEATLALARAVGADEAILAERSPSCGVGEVHDGSFAGRLAPGDGVTAALLARGGICATRARRRAPVGGQENGVLVRAAVRADADDLARLSGQLGYACEAGEVRRRLAPYLGSDSRVVLVGEAEGRVVGWLSLDVIDHFYLPPFVEASGFVVDEACRSRGIGAAIMAAAELWVRARGLGLVRLKTNVAREGAHRFYERIGFERTKTQYVYAKRLG